MASLFNRVGIPACVAGGHLLIFYAAVAFSTETFSPSEPVVTLYLTAPEKAEITPPKQEEKEPENENPQNHKASNPESEQPKDGGNVEDVRAFELAEVQAATQEIPDYTLTEISDAAAGTDGDTFGDGLEFGEVEVPDAKNSLKQNPLPEETIQENPQSEKTKSSPAAANPGAEKIGKQGNAESQKTGTYGSGGEGGKDALATAKFKHRVAPKYPRADELSGRTGTVILLIEISAEGKIKNVRVKKSSGSRSLDSAAVRAARASTYIPAQEGGTAIESHAEATYVFRK